MGKENGVKSRERDVRFRIRRVVGPRNRSFKLVLLFEPEKCCTLKGQNSLESLGGLYNVVSPYK